MQSCPYMLGLREPNIAKKSSIDYDAICKLAEIHNLKKIPKPKKTRKTSKIIVASASRMWRTPSSCSSNGGALDKWCVCRCAGLVVSTLAPDLRGDWGVGGWRTTAKKQTRTTHAPFQSSISITVSYGVCGSWDEK
ncbi:polymerase acidic protein [Striga asiatica]|uniref:Polymerase acidic protein n=1 Tax=Striga asiatica TaxID=4170 RepID=A0A5A7RFE4_STRAF|nr:polymerase acidic protein [Striga asiatica]